MRRNVTQNFVFSIICKLPYYINWTLYPYIKSYDLILSNNFLNFFIFTGKRGKRMNSIMIIEKTGRGTIDILQMKDRVFHILKNVSPCIPGISTIHLLQLSENQCLLEISAWMKIECFAMIKETFTISILIGKSLRR